MEWEQAVRSHEDDQEMKSPSLMTHLHRVLGGGLVAHLADMAGLWADEL